MFGVNLVHRSTQTGWLGHFRATVALSLPLIGIHIAQMLTHTTDVVMLGWYGVDELAATVLASEIYFVVYLVGVGAAQAVMPMIANAHGADDSNRIRQVFRMGNWITIAYAVAVLPVLLLAEPLLIALGQSPHLSALAGDYMKIAAWSMIPTLLVSMLRSLLSALRRPGIALIAILTGAAANALCNYVLIFGNWARLNLEFGAPRSQPSQPGVLTTAILFYTVKRIPETSGRGLFKRLLKPNWTAFREVLRLGWPIGLTLLAEAGLFSSSKVMVGWLGTIPLAAHGIVLQVVAICFMVPLGLSSAATIRAGFAAGQRDHDGLKRGSMMSLALSIAIAFVAATLFLVFPESFVRLFLDQTHPETDRIVEIGITLFFVAAVFQVFDYLQVVILGILRGVEDTKVPMVLVATSYWLIGAPTCLVLGFRFELGAAGIWTGLAIGLCTAAVALSIRLWARLGARARGARIRA